jgi:DNA-binding NtrC family response regulator
MIENKQFTVFLVDDDSMFLDMLNESFSKFQNIKTHLFYSGEDCLNNLNIEPDVIVLDYFFSKSNENAIDGMETLKRINAHNKNIKVIMLTAQEEGEKVYEFIHNGARDYVIKDLEAFDNILDAIDGILEEIQ